MSLPIVLIFNRHWDVTPHLLVKNLLPELAEEGYDTFCQELNDTCSEEAVFKMVEEGIQKTSRVVDLFNSYADKSMFTDGRQFNEHTLEELEGALPFFIRSPHTKEMVREIKAFSSYNAHLNNLHIAKKWAFSIVCIDDTKSSDIITSSTSDANRIRVLIETCSKREIAMVDHLVHLHAENKGIIAPIGASHFKGIMKRLKQIGLGDEDIVCHFPHSSFLYSDLNDMAILRSEVVKDKRTRATTSEEIEILGQKLLAEIRSKKVNAKEF